MITEKTIAIVTKGDSGLNSLMMIPIRGSVKNETMAAISIAIIYLLYAGATASVVYRPANPIRFGIRKNNGIVTYLLALSI